MTSVAMARRAPVRRGDVLLAALAAVALVGSPTSDLIADGPQRVLHYLDAEITFTAALCLLLAGGVAAVRREEQRGNGRIMLLVVLVSVARTASSDFADVGPFAFTADLLQHADSLLVGYLLLRWPLPRLQTRLQRWTVLGAATVPTVLLVAGDLLYDPAAHHWTVPTWWPLLARNDPLADGLFVAAQWTWTGLLLVFGGLIAQRIVRASAPERRELVPIAVAAAFGIASEVASVGERLQLWGDLHALVLYNLASATTPIAMLLALAVRRVRRALAVEDLVTRGRTADSSEVVDALRRAIGDRRLGVATFAPAVGAYVRPDGGIAAAAAPDRRSVFVSASDGSPLARLDLDPRLADRPELISSVAGAASMALETIRLRSELAARAEDEAAVRARLDAATEEGAALSRLLPGRLPEKLRTDPAALGRIDRAEVTVLMSDVRGYSTIAEHAPPELLAGQLQQHRAAMNDAVLAEGGTIMQYVGDAVMAVFGAPFEQPDHASRAVRAAAAMHAAQAAVNAAWSADGLEPFRLGIGLSTGEVATAVLGGADRYEYTIVGDTVNVAQRLESQARPGGTTIASEATVVQAGAATTGFARMTALAVKGRAQPVAAYRWVAAEPGVAWHAADRERPVEGTVPAR